VNTSADTTEPAARRNGSLGLHQSLLKHLHSTGAYQSEVSGVSLLTKEAVADSAEDAPSRTCIRDKQGRMVAVMAVSSRVDPEQVARSLANAKGAREMLGSDLGNVILEPIAEGTYEGLTFALWPWRRSLSSNRIMAFLQKRRARKRVLAWLREATAVTCRRVSEDELEAGYRRPLRALAGDEAMPEGLRRAADTGLRRLEDGTWRPYFVLEHGDFWLGNVLYPRGLWSRGTHARGFVLIDWAGARLQGYPFYDLLRLALSSGLAPAHLRKEALLHCASLGCEPVDAFAYLAAGLGASGLDLGHFPLDRYHAIAETAYRTLKAALNL
jgi:hypothetical protein